MLIWKTQTQPQTQISKITQNQMPTTKSKSNTKPSNPIIQRNLSPYKPPSNPLTQTLNLYNPQNQKETNPITQTINPY